MSNKPMKGPVLALDTATATMAAALTVGGRVVCERSSLSERNHSVKLLPVVDELLREAGIAPRELSAVAVGCGPGSYTGVRIAVTAAKTMAWTLRLPLYSVSTLEALAYGGYRAYRESPAAKAAAPDEEVWMVPLIDARRGQAYTALFAAAGAKDAAAGAGEANEPAVWRRLAADAIVPFRAQAEEWLAAPSRPRKIIFVGEVESRAAAWMDEAFADDGGKRAGAVRLSVSVRARDIAAIARLYGEAVRVSDPHDLLPNYTQLAEAEMKLIESAGRKDEP